MKRTAAELELVEAQGLSLNWLGHVKYQPNEKGEQQGEIRPTGWLRDEKAGLRLSRLQQIQKKMGWATLANLMSASRPVLAGVGMALVGGGHYIAGPAVLVAAGLSDGEGKLARCTGTDDPNVGRIVDVVADLVAAGTAGAVGMAAGVLPPWAVAALYAPKAINMTTAVPAFAINFVKNRRRRHADNLDQTTETELLTKPADQSDLINHHTGNFDKRVEAARWTALAAFVLNYFTQAIPEAAMVVGVGTVAVAGLIGSGMQLKRLLKELRERRAEG